MQVTSGAFRRFARHLVVLMALFFAANEAQAQKLSIQGDRFAIDGVPRFLTFMTYFGAMGDPNIIANLHLIRTLGFDGIRIWPNLDTGPQLMNGDGTLRPAELTRLRSILDQALHERLVVDVSFTYEHIAGMDAARARLGIMAATDALRSYDNILFDIQNERNVGDRRFMSVANVASILAGIRATDSARIVTCSNSPVDDAQYAADFTRQLGLDATAYHEPRSTDWYSLASYQSVVSRMKSNGRPAYLQEPMSTRDNLFAYPSHDRADFFLQAIANAKLAGAAAWCFHTDVGVDFRNGPPFLEDRLRSFAEPEWAFVSSLNARVVLQTSDGVHQLVAESGGGGGVRADRTAAGPGSWEVIGASALTGGPLLSGDHVALTSADGTHYLSAINGGGAALRAAAQAVGGWETFVIEKPGGGIIRHGDLITLRANDTSWYVTAENGGGGNVAVTSTARGAWETFRILFVTPHSSSAASLNRAKAIDRP